MMERCRKYSARLIHSGICMTFVLILLMWHFAELAGVVNPFYGKMAYILWGLEMGLAAVLALNGIVFRQGAVVMIWIEAIWFFILCVVRDGMTRSQLNELVRHGIFAYLICLPWAMAISKEKTRSFLKILIDCWILCTTLLCAASLMAAMTGSNLYNLNGQRFAGISEEYNRLFIFEYCTTSGSEMVISIYLSCLGMILHQNKAAKLLLGISLIMQFVCLSLTVARTSYICAGIVIGAFLCYELVIHGVTKKIKRAFCRVIAVAAVLVTAVVIVYSGLNATIDLFNDIRAMWNNREMIPSAEAETIRPDSEGKADHADVRQRKLFTRDALSGRDKVWKASLNLLFKSPKNALFGVSATDFMSEVNELTGVSLVYEHPHNILLLIWLEGGLVGLTVYLAFLWILIRSAIQLFKRSSMEKWMKLLPVLPAVILISDMMESLMWIRYGFPQLNFFLLFAGLTIRLGHYEARKEQPSSLQ